MLHVKDLMSRNVFSLNEQDSLLDVRGLMALKRIRHIPILDVDNNFSGIITHRDLLSVTISRLADIDDITQMEIDSGIPIKEVMRTEVQTVSPEETVIEAARLILEHKFGCLPVVENGKLVGIITEADFLKLTITLLETTQQQ